MAERREKEAKEAKAAETQARKRAERKEKEATDAKLAEMNARKIADDRRREAVEFGSLAEMRLVELNLALARQKQESYCHLIDLAWREFNADNSRLAAEFLNDCPQELRNWEWYFLHRLSIKDEENFSAARFRDISSAETPMMLLTRPHSAPMAPISHLRYGTAMKQQFSTLIPAKSLPQ